MKWAVYQAQSVIVKITQKDAAFARGWSAFHRQAGQEVSEVSIFHIYVFVFIYIGHKSNEHVLPVVSWMLLLQMRLKLKQTR